jgi:hypothetical protein
MSKKKNHEEDCGDSLFMIDYYGKGCIAWVFDELYSQNFFFCLSVDAATITKHLKERALEPQNIPNWRDVAGCLVTATGVDDGHSAYCVVLWNDGKAVKRITHGFDTTLAHECLHAVNRTLGARGIKLDDLSTNQDEVQAYYMTWIMEQAYKAVDMLKRHRKNA